MPVSTSRWSVCWCERPGTGCVHLEISPVESPEEVVWIDSGLVAGSRASNKDEAAEQQEQT